MSKIKTETWNAYLINNPYNDTIYYAYTCDNMYYFKNMETGEESPVYKVHLGKTALRRFKWYKKMQMELYSVRKNLFLQND